MSFLSGGPMQFRKDPVFHIWPKAKIRPTLIPTRRCTARHVEARIGEIFPGSNPVLFSSGRSGLLAALTALAVKRTDTVWVPPFSSHCVWSTVGFLGTPTTSLVPQPRFALAYHQWGYVQNFSAAKDAKYEDAIIEDSVDSLCISTDSMFPNKGRFELFSLPKILGSAFGGVVMCRKPIDAENLRLQRDRGLKLSLTHHLRRLAQDYSMQEYLYWANTDALNGPVPSVVCHDALVALERWEENIADRKQKVKLLKDFALEPVTEGGSRLQSCLTMANTEAHSSILVDCGFELGPRSRILLNGFSVETPSVLLVPLHHQIPLAAIEKLASRLTSSQARHLDRSKIHFTASHT